MKEAARYDQTRDSMPAMVEWMCEEETQGFADNLEVEWGEKEIRYCIQKAPVRHQHEGQPNPKNVRLRKLTRPGSAAGTRRIRRSKILTSQLERLGGTDTLERPDLVANAC